MKLIKLYNFKTEEALNKISSIIISKTEVELRLLFADGIEVNIIYDPQIRKEYSMKPLKILERPFIFFSQPKSELIHVSLPSFKDLLIVLIFGLKSTLGIDTNI